jgi:hypothetical protein
VVSFFFAMLLVLFALYSLLSDISIYLQLLPRSSCFYRLFQQIEYSIEDCEIIHKIPSLSSSHFQEKSSRKLIKAKKSAKNKSKMTSTVTALTRHE